MYIYQYTYMYINKYICRYIYIDIDMYICIYIHIYIRRCIYAQLFGWRSRLLNLTPENAGRQRPARKWRRTFDRTCLIFKKFDQPLSCVLLILRKRFLKNEA